MRKVTTINLGGNAYQVDEDGYEALRVYLDDAERALGANPDRAEILQDLEQAIGDKCDGFLGRHKNVVSAAEMQQILKEMGPVADGAAESGARASAAAGAAAGPEASGGPPPGPRPRRLYRIRDDSAWTITGVSNGMAAYVDIDVAWVRLLWIIATAMSGGALAIAYVVLVFLMPIANTPEEYAAAHGAPFNAQDVIDRLRSKKGAVGGTPDGSASVR